MRPVTLAGLAYRSDFWTPFEYPRCTDHKSLRPNPCHWNARRRGYRRHSSRLEVTAMRTILLAAALSTSLFLTACGGTDRRQSVDLAASRSAPTYLELRADVSAGTLHFPRGVYVLDSEDRNGYYYRAPLKIRERSFYGGLPHDGGIFVSKRNQRKLRGYVIMPYGLTHVGNLSSADYQFRD